MRTLTRFTTGPMTALDRRYDTQIHRRVTRTVMVGDAVSYTHLRAHET